MRYSSFPTRGFDSSSLIFHNHSLGFASNVSEYALLLRCEFKLGPWLSCFWTKSNFLSTHKNQKYKLLRALYELCQKKKKKPRKVRRTLFCLLFLYTFLHKAWLRNWSAFGWLALTVCLSCVGDNLKLHLSYRKPILRHWMPISFLNFWAMHSHYCIFTTPHACSSLTDQHVYMQDAYWASRWKYIHLSIFSS